MSEPVIDKQSLEFILFLQNLLKEIENISYMYYIHGFEKEMLSHLVLFKNYAKNTTFIDVDFSNLKEVKKIFSFIQDNKSKKLIIFDLDKEIDFHFICRALSPNDLVLLNKKFIEDNIYYKYGLEEKQEHNNWTLVAQKISYKDALNCSIPA